MDRQSLSRFRLGLAIFWALSAAYFVVITPTLGGQAGPTRALDVDASIGFWLSLAGFYATAYCFHRRQRNYGALKGAGRITSALTTLLWFLAYLWIHSDGRSPYETLVVMLAAITYGGAALLTLAVVVAKRRLRKLRAQDPS